MSWQKRATSIDEFDHRASHDHTCKLQQRLINNDDEIMDGMSGCSRDDDDDDDDDDGGERW